MAQTNPKLHLPYAIRYMARLQEQAAQTLEADDKRAEDLNQHALQLRVAARSLTHTFPLPQTQIAANAPQKIKLLNWLRQAK